MIDGFESSIALLSVSAICFLLLLYPYIVYPAILSLMPRRSFRAQSSPVESTPKVALLFCAYNEEQSLQSKIDNIRKIKKRCPDIEVRAYTDGCSDGTVEMLRAASDCIILHEGKTRIGKAAGMSEMVKATDADIVVFTDANVILDEEAVPRIVSYFENAEIGTVAGTLHYVSSDDSHAARTGTLYWRLEERIKRLESETGSTMGADGSIFSVRRALYPVVPRHLLDDMISSISPIFSGYRVVSAPDVHAFEKVTTDSGDEFRRKRRIACRAFNTHRHIAPQLRSMSVLNRFKYFSHKYLRWFSAAFLLLGAVFALGGIAQLVGPFAATLVLIAGVAVLVLGHKLSLPIIGTVAEILISIVGVGFGIAEALAGRNYQTWNPAKSRQ